MMRKDYRRHIRTAGKKNCCPGDPGGGMFCQMPQELVERHLLLAGSLQKRLPSALPGCHETVHNCRNRKGNPSPRDDLEDVGAEEAHVHDQEDPGEESHQPWFPY